MTDERVERIIQNIERVIIGKRDVIELAMVALLAEGHILLEDVPGLGKTLLAKSIARSLGCTFQRIQFTPDLLPSDVTGISFYNQKQQEFEFRPGPILSQIVLADEINRATPRTQSALLEAMAEGRVTVDGVTHELAPPFLVVATQNPIDHEGTFPLPEAQLDRFLMRFSIGYPSAEDELKMLEILEREHPVNRVQPVVSAEELVAAQQAVREVYVDPVIKQYIVSIVSATRHHPDIYLGASPRGSLGLVNTARALSALEGRDYVLPDDVQALLEPVLAHRLVPSAKPRLRGETPHSILQSIVAQVPVPVEEDWRGGPAE